MTANTTLTNMTPNTTAVDDDSSGGGSNNNNTLIAVFLILVIVIIVGIIVLTIKQRKKKEQTVGYNEHKDEESKEKQRAILLATGSFNPIHTGHVDMMNFAKKELESLGKYTVIGGFMSPSHDSYVSTKGSYIGSDDRIEMIKLAVEDSDWIE